MTTLISDAAKAEIAAVFDDIHDTFARDIIIYKTEIGVLLSSDLNANPIYGRSSDGTSSKPQTKAYSGRARIKYAENQKAQDGAFGGSSDSAAGLSFPIGDIRLKIDAEAYALLKAAQKIEIDGKICQIVSESARPGPFAPKYYTIF